MGQASRRARPSRATGESSTVPRASQSGRIGMDYPYDLGPYARTVTTTSAVAQRWFDRGLNWCFGYHHEEAIACFEKALEADPDCAMAHWGVAYAAGPNYNYPWELQDPAGKAVALARCHDATHAALAL